jgi:hypothetical protein
VRLALHGRVDLRARIERALEHAPAGHPLPRPARLGFGNGSRLLELDAAEIEIVRSELLDIGMAREVAMK